VSAQDRPTNTSAVQSHPWLQKTPRPLLREIGGLAGCRFDRLRVITQKLREGDARMVTADEIRARVEAADRARGHARADAAAQIAADVERRTTVAAELAEIDASLTARIDAAAAVMTLAELAEFTGIPETELRAVGSRTGESRSRRTTRGKSQRGNSATRAARSRLAVAPLPAGTDTPTGAIDPDQSA